MKAAPGANLLALAAIALWALLAWLGLALSHLPPFLLTGLALLIGGVMALPMMWRHGRLDVSAWQLPWQHLLLGIYGLFGFHFLLFMALRHAPPVQANLVNYLWPLGMVVMAPLFLPGIRLKALHVLAACMGFAGACIAILGRSSEPMAVAQAGGGGSDGLAWGYVLAVGSAFIWASYSLLTKRIALQGNSFSTAAIGLFGVLSGVLSLLCHALLEPRVMLSARDAWLLLAMGLGPMGAAFYLWDAALKRGDASQIGILSYITPLASTAVLLSITGQALSWSIVAAAVLIVGAALLGSKA